MTTVVLLRHGRTSANTSGVLAGRKPGVELDRRGRQQVTVVGQRLAGAPLAAVVTSPLRRCRQTAHAVLAARADQVPLHVEQGLVECGYGEWTGRSLKELSQEKLWPTVQQQPSAVRFPGGESMTEMAARSVGAIRRWDSQLTAERGEHAVWVAVSHGDVIKAILADALGMHLDSFQRILVDPASVSIVRYTAQRPYVVTVNSTGVDLAALLQPPPPPSPAAAPPPGDAPVGGGLGTGADAGPEEPPEQAPDR
jgi:2,3-bisphosphoglycerate-dependent phosphoglycerate mutase